METKTGEEFIEKVDQTLPPSAPEDGPEALHRLSEQVPEILDYLSFYLRTQIDRTKLSAKRMGGYLALGIVSLFLVIQVLYLSLSLLFRGLSEGVTVYFPQTPWMGPVLLGGGVVLILLMGLLVGYLWIRFGLVRKIKKEYAREFHEQKIKYGHSLPEQATSVHSEEG